VRETAVTLRETAAAVDLLAVSSDRQKIWSNVSSATMPPVHKLAFLFRRFSVRPGSAYLGRHQLRRSAAMLHLTLDTSQPSTGEVQDRVE